MTNRQKIAIGLFIGAGIHTMLIPTGAALVLLTGGGVIMACFAGVLLLTDKR